MFLGTRKFGGHKRNLVGQCPRKHPRGYGLAQNYRIGYQLQLMSSTLTGLLAVACCFAATLRQCEAREL